MTYKRTSPVTYVVAWDSELIIKAGSTQRQRYRGFVLRGARLVAVYVPVPGLSAIHLEEKLGAALSRSGVRPFVNGHQAEGHLGNRGGGWRECWEFEAYAFKQMLEHVLPSIAAEHIQLSISTDVTVRTNDRQFNQPEESFS